MHDYYGVKIPSDLAGAMLCAILSDTVIFKSPTCTETDKKAAHELAKIAGVKDINALGMEMFKAKSNLDATPKELLFRDFKDFDMHGKKVGIGQLELVSLNMVSADLIKQLKQELINAKKDGRDAVLLVLTDIMKEGSAVYVESDNKDLVLNALGAQKEGDFVQGLMSRKKQTVPALLEAYKN